MEQMNSIHSVEAMILSDEILRHRAYHTGYIILLVSLAAMMIVGGGLLYLIPELELVGITLVLTSVIVGFAYMITLKVRGIIGAASEVVIKTNEQRKAAGIEIVLRGALFAVLVMVFTWLTDDEVKPVRLAFTGIFNFVFWSLGMYAYYVIRRKRKSTGEPSSGV